ncbi:hypothetical protein M378DRAFT_16731 [Amanita muscaria Koide BX008]|uniref:Uncharacterized protein n=1 Tax=Amanita muscaria (strain Koide BX008) TaxID=946122 RepID=A0A0C2SS42_AMAMK|nr:hypothetical protein M378DRAFT_16731 [Amanita muscaria Koide BX008]
MPCTVTGGAAVIIDGNDLLNYITNAPGFNILHPDSPYCCNISERFLDLEAEVDHEEESPPEESEEELDDIIDDDDVDTNLLDYPPGIVRFNNLMEENADAEHFFDILYNRASVRPGDMKQTASQDLWHPWTPFFIGLNAAMVASWMQYYACSSSSSRIHPSTTFAPSSPMVQQLLHPVPGLLFSSGCSFLDNIPVGRLFFDQVPPTEVIATLTAPPYNPYQPEQWVKAWPARPSPQLFNPQAVAFSFEEQPRPGDTDHIWRFNGLTFDHGLLRKTFKPSSASGYPIHPSLFEKPNRPLEWDFSPEDKVILVSCWRKGQNTIVMAVEECALEVEVSTGEVISVPWNDVQKDIKIGSFVKVLCGLHSGETGWVDKSFSVHANSVAMVDPSFSFLQPTALTDEQLEISAKLRRKDPMPWIKRWVVVSKDGHALRGRYGQVVNVRPHQSTRSGLKIEVEMSYYNPNASFQRHIFDYDHLKDFQYNTELYTLPVPELYRPRHQVTPYPIGDLAQSRYGHTSNQLLTTPGYQSNTGGATLMYSLSTPVPSTPGIPSRPHLCGYTIVFSTIVVVAVFSTPCCTPDDTRHPLASSSRNHGCLSRGNGQPRIHHRNHGTVTILDPDWVSLPTVNVTRYDGLLVVIKGKHLEKRALVAFVNRVSVQDTLTGKEQHLPADVLAMVSEEKADKDRNNVVVQARRKDARSRMSLSNQITSAQPVCPINSPRNT